MNPKAQAEMQANADKICAGLEAFLADPENAKLPWDRPWTPSGMNPFPHNPTTGNTYKGVNVLILWMKGYGDTRWMGFNQAKEALGYKRSGKGRFAKWIWKGEGEDPGYGVRKGEKGTKILRPRMVKDPENGPDAMKCIGWASSTVFNAQQIEGWPAFETPEIPDVDPGEGYFNAARVLECWPVPVSHAGDRAFYRPGDDTITLPLPGAFTDLSAYWATRGHEVIHSTGHKSRLDRLDGLSYAEEELVAELGSVFLCAALGIDRPSMDNHFTYIQGWMKRIKEDPTLIRRMAGKAFRAMELVLDKGGYDG